MNTIDEPIRPFRWSGTHVHAGYYYADVAGINGRHTVGIYFDRDGNILGHTIRAGRREVELIERMVAEVERRGVELPREDNA